ncbi:MAG: nucleoside kinase [bacterium]
MPDHLTITIAGRQHRVAPSAQVMTLVPPGRAGALEQPLAAVYNNRLVSLSYPLRSGGELRWVTLADRAGWDLYRRSACLMLYEAALRIDPNLRLVLHQTHGDGLYYEVRRGAGSGAPISRQECAALEAGMRALRDEDLAFVVRRISVDEARDLLRDRGHEDKLFLLRTHWETSVRIVSCGGFTDLFHNPVAYTTGAIRSFRVTPYAPGVLLRLPVRTSTKVQGRAQVDRKLFDKLTESRAWSRQLGVENLGQLNALAVAGRIDRLIRVAEGGHEKNIASIADQITARRDRVRLVLIAGPSSSGKTTFVKRLAVQLQVNGIQPVELSVDNFFVARSRTPRDAQGRLDFECLEALDLELFNQVLTELFERGETRVPRYDFHTGKPTRKSGWSTLRLSPEQVVLVEGIHALNPALTPAVTARKKYKIYISALTQLAIDEHNRIFTSDTRLIRRIVRDRRYRGYSAADTLRRWPLVRRGEMRHIFPYQGQSDVMFNSALVYEHALLKNYAERYLLEVDERDEMFPEAYRLLGFLRLIVPILPDDVPHNSLLREFVGGSAFSY